MGYIDYESGETPEERRMRLLAEMGSPFLGTRRDADLGTIDSGGVFGMGPQGFTAQPEAPGLAMLGSPYLDPGQRAPGGYRDPGSDYVDPGTVRGGSGVPYLDPGQRVPGSYRDPGSDYVDPGTVRGGSGRDYTDPPPRLGNLFSKPGEPPQPEQDGILFNGTRSPAGRDVLGQEVAGPGVPSGPLSAPRGLDVQGANNQDRTNAPKAPDAPQTSAPISLPSMAGGLGAGPATAYGSTTPRVGAAPAAPTAAAPSLAQPQAAAVADGLSRKPGSAASTNWLADNADLFIAIGAGLLSGKNIGEGIIQGLKLANDQKSSSAKQKLADEKNMAENLKRAAHAASLQKAFPGMSPEMALAQSEDSDLVKRAQQILFPDPESGPDWVREKDANGTDILRNTKTGDMKAAPKADTADKPARPLTAAEKTQWGIPQDDARPYAISEGKAPTLIGGQQPFESPAQAAQKAEATARISASTDQATKLASNRLAAQTNMSLARYTEQLLNEVEPGAITGAAAQLREKFGLNMDANGGKVQALQAALERLANDQHKVGTGTVSDADLRSFAKQVPSIFGTKEGNAMIMDTIKGVAEYNEKATAVASQWRSGKIGLDEMNNRLEALPNPMDNFQRYQSERGSRTTPGTDPAAAGGGAAAPAAGARVPMYDPKTRTFR
jgi:hypothetical protein